jgi:hypothetical protein
LQSRNVSITPWSSCGGNVRNRRFCDFHISIRPGPRKVFISVWTITTDMPTWGHLKKGKFMYAKLEAFSKGVDRAR